MARKIFFVRHTETDWNRQGRYSGQSDAPTLTGKGLQQAYELAQKFPKHDIAKVICSDLRRARDTALILASPHGEVPIVDKRLREVGLGRMDGLLKEEVKKLYPDERFSTHSQSFDFSELGGESRIVVIARHAEVLGSLVSSLNDGCAALVVGHGTSLRTFLESIGENTPIKQGGYVTVWY